MNPDFFRQSFFFNQNIQKITNFFFIKQHEIFHGKKITDSSKQNEQMIGQRNTMRRDLLDNVLQLWAGIFLLNI